MLKSYKATSAKRILKEEQLEIVDVISEGSASSGYSSKSKHYLRDLEMKVKTTLMARFKDLNYEILLVVDEDYKSFSVVKIVILLDDQEKINYLKSKIKDTVSYRILKKLPENIHTTFFKALIQSWSNEIQNYLANEFNFKGNTKIQASVCDKKICSFKATASGKGMNENISKVLKKLSADITSGLIDVNVKDKFTIIDSFFEKLK